MTAQPNNNGAAHHCTGKAAPQTTNTVSQYYGKWQESEFDIFSHLDKAEILKETSTEIWINCPNCGGHKVKIQKNGPHAGRYADYTGTCTPEQIRNAIAPWEEKQSQRERRLIPATNKFRSKQSKKPKPAPIPEGEIVLAEFEQAPQTPQYHYTDPEGLERVVWYNYAEDKAVKRIERYDNEGIRLGKDFYPHHKNHSGKWKLGRGESQWDAYRLSEALNLGIDKWVVGIEGEKVVEAVRERLLLVAITWLGAGGWNEQSFIATFETLKQSGCAGLVYFPDHDQVGQKKLADLQNAAAKAQFPLIAIAPTALWEDMPEKGDIVDWMNAHPDWSREQFIQRMNELIGISQKQSEEQQLSEEDFDDNGGGGGRLISEQLSFCQIVFQQLYSDPEEPYICVADKLYRWTDNHYAEVSDAEEKVRISNWCDSYYILTRDGNLWIKTYPYSNMAKVKEALEVAKTKLAKKPSLINPPGLNCLNGILQIVWDGPKPSWQLLPHSPDYYYTYAPLVAYDPDAPTEDCDRLLAALDEPECRLFLKVVAASLDLKTVRQFKGRSIRALLLRGTGSNGKDALREAIATIYGQHGVTSATLADFQQYDDGRRFPLSCLLGSRINWASENTNTSKLDKIQCLKAAVTGNILVSEAKGRDGVQFNPQTIFLFNLNDVPNLTGALEAIKSRYGIINFHKTFKIGADPAKGEVEADPRFAYDPLFLRLNVCPALLNRILAALKDLMETGLDYSSSQEALEAIQAENSHLFQFVQESGLGYAEGKFLSASQIWEKLEQWYLDNGTLEYEEKENGKKRAIWADQPRFGDRNVKAVNQVLARFKQLFPQAKTSTIPHPSGKRNIPVLFGVDFNSRFNQKNSLAISEDSTPNAPQSSPQSSPQQTLVDQDFHTTHPNYSDSETQNSGEIKNSSEVTEVSEHPTQSTTEKIEQLEFNAEGNAQLLRECLADQSLGWEMVDELRSCWTEDQKSQVAKLLSEEEKEALAMNPETAVPAPVESTPAPAQYNFQIGDKVYYMLHTYTIVEIRGHLAICQESNGTERKIDMYYLRRLR